MRKKQSNPGITQDERIYRGGEPTQAPPSPVGTTAPGEDATSQQPRRRNLSDVVSDASTAYVSSSPEYPFYWGDRALPPLIDDAEKQFGADIYERMLNEATLQAALKAFKYAVLSDGLTVMPAFPAPNKGSAPEEIANHEKAVKMADYIRAVIDRLGTMDRPIMETLNNALDCFYKGHKLAEMTADVIQSGPYKGKAGLSSFRCKPRQNYAFVVNTGTNEFRGVVAKVPGGSIALRNGLVWDAANLPNTIAPEKLIIFTLDDEDGDPRGKSAFRGAYDAWYRKQQAKVEHLKSLMRFAGGMISAICPPEKQGITYINPVTGKADNLTNCIVSAAAMMGNGRATAFPNETEVNVHMPSTAVNAFNPAFEMLDREIIMALLLSARAILEAQHSSKADSDTAQDLFDELKMFARDRFCTRLSLKMFRWLIAISWGEEWLTYCPVATMQKSSRPDFAHNCAAVAQLAGSAWWTSVTAEQIDHLNTEVLGLPAGVNEDALGPPDAGLVQADNEDGAGATPPAKQAKGGKTGAKPAGFLDPFGRRGRGTAFDQGRAERDRDARSGARSRTEPVEAGEPHREGTHPERRGLSARDARLLAEAQASQLALDKWRDQRRRVGQ